ncbi:MAG: polyhydroxyalkanoate synthesis repressor PhaR [Marinobacterium sp.]|jgi:polyhydroxyalkanoate synthesis repressor PhaR|uniref:polyhydroxyalkanoate synthesis repressor PhaR n=1 Tax=Marinobacterium TaxID=48075 RepID=UPI001F5C2A41|nr:polyhydroxyalkanoate synthesis repressor PhaR [Marinobacterium iners]
MSQSGTGEAAVRILRKYTNRRLYDTSRSCYVTLEDVKQLVLSGEKFQVQDSKTGNDLTRNILLQIISEQEAEGHGTLLTNQVLQQLIRFYGDSMQGMMSQYLEQSIAAFLEHQDRIREQMQTMMGAANPLTMMGRFADQNMAVWNMFAPRGSEATEEEQTADASAKTEATRETAKTGDSTKAASSSKSSKA